jgi:carboxymethylenebutenolidase
MTGKTISIKTKTGDGYTGYLAMPEKPNGSAMLVIQEIFGVNSHIRDVADLYAQAGYIALAPDVFWRAQPKVELSYTPEDIQKGMALVQKSDWNQLVTDLQDAGTTLRQMPEFKKKLGVVGYCLGGTLSYSLATRDAVDVAVGYYGGNIDNYLSEATNLHCPLMLHFGAKDNHIPLSKVQTITAALEGKGHVEIYIYDADHGFNCDQRQSYDRRSAMLAFGRSMILLNHCLA